MLKFASQLSEVKVRFIAPVRLAFVSARGPYSRSVGEAWEQVFHWLKSQGHMEPIGIGYGLAHDDPQTTLSSKIRYDAGIPVPATWREGDETFVHVRTFKGGSYTSQRYVGPYENVGRMISVTGASARPSLQAASMSRT